MDKKHGDVFQKETFDLVITDLSMPNMNGDILASKIKKHNINMPVIMLTGFCGKTSQKAIVDAVVSKPITSPELRKVLIETINL